MNVISRDFDRQFWKGCGSKTMTDSEKLMTPMSIDNHLKFMHKKSQPSISNISIFKKSKPESDEKSMFFVNFSAARGRSEVVR